MTRNAATSETVAPSWNLVYEIYRNYGPPDLSYRLWHLGDPVKGKPNIILVHGASIRLGGKECEIPILGHVRERPNHCFCNLANLLRNELYGGYNVWEFEYSDEYFFDPFTHVPIEDPTTHEKLCFNFGCLDKYGTRLRQAIDAVKRENPGVNVYIIAHSMGGLVARYAAQDGTVNKIVTLDTGHYGFNLAGFFDVVMQNLPKNVRDKTCVVHDTAPGSKFLNDLNCAFRHCRVRLLSLAAGDPFPLPVGRIVEFESAHLGEVCPDGGKRYNNQCTPCDIVPYVNHLTIVEIYSEYQYQTFCKIAAFLGHPC
jgi:pimeloyl-ACP methyl ester carboxylesterase